MHDEHSLHTPAIGLFVQYSRVIYYVAIVSTTCASTFSEASVAANCGDRLMEMTGRSRLYHRHPLLEFNIGPKPITVPCLVVLLLN
jgi:hypothetical protein